MKLTGGWGEKEQINRYNISSDTFLSTTAQRNSSHVSLIDALGPGGTWYDGKGTHEMMIVG